MASNAVKSWYRLYVANIPWTVGHIELRKYFSKFGNITSSTVVFDKNTGLSKNYGFVVFSSNEAYQKSLSNSHKLEGNILRVEKSENHNQPGN